MNLILNTIEAGRIKEARKLISQSLAECEMCVDEGRFQLYYFCEILEYFVSRYVADDSTAEMVSSYVTQYLAIITRGTHSVDVESIQYVLKLCLGKLALGRQLVGVLDNLVGRNSLGMIVGVMGKLNTKVKKKNRCTLVEWLYGNVGTDDMDDSFDMLIKKIEQGEVLYQPKQQSSAQEHPYIVHHPQQQLSTQEHPYNTHHSPQQSNQPFAKQEQSRQQWSGKSKQMEVQPSCTLQNLQLSKISHHENEENVDAKWQYFLHKHYPKESSPPAHSPHMQSHVDDEGSKGDGSEDEECENKQQQSVGNVEHYKQYIRKIRQSYLPKQYLQQKQQKQQQQSHKQSYEQESPQQKHEQQPHFNDEQKSEQPEEQAQQQLEQPSLKTSEIGEKYSVLNEKKISYMLQNSTNPYTHLRNQIIVGLKSQSDKNTFLEELLTFMQNQPTIKKPHIYDAFVLVIVLLFAEIRENKALIGPLQNLYQFMASVHSTNRFLSCIFTHLHRVMEQTAAASRQFLIKILTKSISRLMPFAQEPVQLLRDLCQFYSIGQNVYFEMYEKEYSTILSSIQDEPLGEVVEKALIEEGQHLTVIVQGWFQTRLKQRVQSYMNEIINDES